MTPYPGESIGLISAAAVAGGVGDFSLALDVTYRGAYFDDTANGHRAFAAGDEWRGWALGYGTYQDDDTIDATFSWVVEVLSGSVTFTASEGFDPDYGDPTVAPTRTLGTFTAGPGTTFIPSGFTVAEGWADTAAFMLVIEATAGSADVQQVKLRLWPDPAPVGGWSDVKPAWAGDWIDEAPRYAEFTGDHDATTSTAATSWDAAWSGVPLTPAAPGPHEFSDTEPLLSTYTDQNRPTLDDYYTRVHTAAEIALLVGRDWRDLMGIEPLTYTEGVDWIRPPEEVDGDLDTYTQQTGEGGVEWRRASVVIKILGATNPLGGINLFSESFDDLALTDGGTPGSVVADVDLHAGLTVATVGASDVVEEEPIADGGRFLVVSVTHSSMLDTGVVPGWPGTAPGFLASILHTCSATVEFGTLGSEGVDPIQSRATMPPYRFWSPSPPAAVGIVRHWPRNDGRRATAPARLAQQTSYQAGRGAGYS